MSNAPLNHDEEPPLHPLERKVLLLFKEGVSLSEAQILAADPTLQPAQISMALGWLQAKEILTVCDEQREAWIVLTERGEGYASTKHPALVILDDVAQHPLPLQEVGLTLDPEDRRSTIGVLKNRGLISIQPGGKVVRSDLEIPEEFIKLQQILQSTKNKSCLLMSFSEEEQAVIRAYHHKRSPSKGLFRIDERILRRVSPTSRFSAVYETLCHTSIADEIGVLTPEMLKEESWHGRSFRKYNLNLPPPRISGGRRHPYALFLKRVREKMMAMGFTEMQGPLIESEFWNMDALYMPQFHPARAIHDVYFVQGPMRDETLPKTLIDRVAETHEKGSLAGQPVSTGWRYRFDQERTRRLILRSQGTAVSARKLAEGPPSGKYFSIARCFRYDAVDATHAPDFFQIEGIVLGEEIHFRTLLGLLTLFAKEIAKAENVRFLPAYFPFTEPSVELHVAHPKLGWMELGGAGLFRPEVTEPLGVHLPVIAWGLGLDRLAMMALEISDIRDLFATDLEQIRNTPLLREDFTVSSPSTVQIAGGTC